jgi:hypothetical protein
MNEQHCASCKAIIAEGKSAVYDENTEHYFCNRYCFEDWADDHFEQVADFYAKLNVSDVCL